MIDPPKRWFTDQNAAAYRKLAQRVPQYGRFVEVGCYLGRSLSRILDILVGQQAEVHVVDIWVKGEDAYQQFLKWRASVPEATVEIHKRESWLAAQEFKDQSLDLCFIDANHNYYPYLLDLHVWWPKMRPGSVICGHDYDQGHRPLQRATDEFFGQLGLPVSVTGGNIWSVEVPDA